MENGQIHDDGEAVYETGIYIYIWTSTQTEYLNQTARKECLDHFHDFESYLAAPFSARKGFGNPRFLKNFFSFKNFALCLRW